MANIRVQICKSHRPNVLAGARVKIELEGVGSIELHDCRLLKNKANIVWASLPTYSVQIGRGYEYHPTCVLSPTLHQEVTAAILKAYEVRATAEVG